MDCPMCGGYVVPSLNSWARHFRYTHPEVRTPQPIPFPLDGPTQESSSPMNETFQQSFAKIFKEAFDLLVARQRKYGPENIRQLGLFGVFGRLADDKIERIRRGMNGRIEHGKVIIEDFSDFGDESFEDALLDIANYALIMLALKRGAWGNPLSPDASHLVLMAEEAETAADPRFLDLGSLPSWNDYGFLMKSIPPQDPFGPHVTLAASEEEAAMGDMGTD